MRYGTVGLEFLVVFLLFVLVGWWADRRLAAGGYGLTVLGGIVGFSIAMYRLTKQGWEILNDPRGGRSAEDDTDEADRERPNDE